MLARACPGAVGAPSALPPALARTAPGGRRALLAKVMDGHAEQVDSDAAVVLRFHLAKGCYATSVVRALGLDEVHG